jgi:hypothetical protein
VILPPVPKPSEPVPGSHRRLNRVLSTRARDHAEPHAVSTVPAIGKEDELEVGRATGWQIEEDEDGGFRWTAFGPRGRREGRTATRADAEAAARQAEQGLTEEQPPT